MAVKKMRLDSKAKFGILILTAALQAAPALAEVVVEERSTWASPAEVEEMKADFQARQAQQIQQALQQQPQQRQASRASSASVTTDSSVSISGTVPEGARWLMIVTQKEGVEGYFQDSTPVTGGASIPTVYIHQGPGNYKIWLYFSRSPDKTTNSYENFLSTSVRNEDARDKAFLLPSLNIQSEDPEIVALAEKITRGHRSDRDKALAIHDWLTHQMVYDSAGIRSGEYVTRPQDAKEVMHSKLAVCDGFSNLFAALARASGLQAKVITGPLGIPNSNLSSEQVCDYKRNGVTGALHAWNEVYIDHRWVTVDATLDTGSTNTRTVVYEVASGQPVKSSKSSKSKSPKKEASESSPRYEVKDITAWERKPVRDLFDPLPSKFEFDHTKCVEELR